MQLTCPYCGFSKAVAADRLPQNVVKVTCPKCKQDFPLTPQQPLPCETTNTRVTTEALAAGQQTAVNQRVEDVPKAGFWLRLVAAGIDMILVFFLQLVLGAALGFAGGKILGIDSSSAVNLALLIELFTYVLSFAYYIVFTGYCGQTPGKMALRIKVIRCNGEEISYGRAAFREIPAKFIAGIILGIGYLMVAFDSQKQGLHDRMANTYVIKL